MLFLFAVIESLIQGFYSPFSLSFLGPVYSVITLIQDLIGVMVIIAITWALLRRFVFRIPRLQVDKSGSLDAVFILMMIFVVVISMFGQNMSGIASNNFTFHENEVRPVSSALASIFYSEPGESTILYYEIY